MLSTDTPGRCLLWIVTPAILPDAAGGLHAVAPACLPLGACPVLLPSDPGMLLRAPCALVFKVLLPLAAPALMQRTLLMAALGLLSLLSPSRPRQGECSLLQSTLPALVRRALLLTAHGRISGLSSRRPSSPKQRLRADGLCSIGLPRSCQCSGCPCMRAQCPRRRLLPATLLQACRGLSLGRLGCQGAAPRILP